MTTPLIEALDESDDSAFVLSSDLRILHTNHGYNSFAERNGGSATLRRWTIGSSIDDALRPPLRDFYCNAYQSALGSGERWDHEYECSSPANYRRFRMFVYPMDGGRLLVVNSLIVETPHPGLDHPPSAMYSVRGFLTMCANCRRTLNPTARRWDWVSAYVEQASSFVSHGLCPVCAEFYYPSTD